MKNHWLFYDKIEEFVKTRLAHDKVEFRQEIFDKCVWCSGEFLNKIGWKLTDRYYYTYWQEGSYYFYGPLKVLADNGGPVQYDIAERELREWIRKMMGK